MKNFKEDIGVTACTYVLVKILLGIVNNDEINVVIQDLFNAMGTTIINLIVLYYLFISKFYEIYKDKDVSGSLIWKEGKDSGSGSNKKSKEDMNMNIIIKTNELQ
eukprot:jgi/Orpsp1_1/1176402/evm.model.c7180000057465.1